MCFMSSWTITVPSSPPDEITPYLNTAWACCCWRKGKRRCWVFLNIPSSIRWQNPEIFGSWASAAYSNSCSMGNLIVSGLWHQTHKICPSDLFSITIKTQPTALKTSLVPIQSEDEWSDMVTKSEEALAIAPYHREFCPFLNCLNLVCGGLFPDPGVLPTSV